jgi:hypothetical protein
MEAHVKEQRIDGAVSEVVPKRWRPARVGALALAVGMSVVMAVAALAQAAPRGTNVDCSQDPLALQPAITAAAPGDTLSVKGTCTGNYLVDKDLTINGQGNAVLDGQNLDTVLSTAREVTLELDKLTITNGNATDGGGIEIVNNSTVDATRLTVTGNRASTLGGGIHLQFDGSTLILDNSTVSDNTQFGASGSGGGIYNQGTATITRSALIDNTARRGGGLITFGTPVTIDQSRVTGNSATVDSGGLENNFGNLRVTNTLVNKNSAGFSGGGLTNANGMTTLEQSRVINNTAERNGGGIFNISGSGSLTLRKSTVAGNEASDGGGIFNLRGGPITLDQSRVVGNKPNNCAPSGSVPGCSN